MSGPSQTVPDPVGEYPTAAVDAHFGVHENVVLVVRGPLDPPAGGPEPFDIGQPLLEAFSAYREACAPVPACGQGRTAPRSRSFGPW